MEKKFTIDEFQIQKELRRRKRKVWVQNKIRSIGNWISRNKELIILFGPATLGAVTVGIRAVNKHRVLKKEENLKNLYCYDRSLGHYWKLRRELTNSEWLEIDKRKRNGERLSDILGELKVLK